MAGCARAHEYLCNLWCIYFLQACPHLFFLLSIAILPPSNTEMGSLLCLPQTCRRRASPRSGRQEGAATRQAYSEGQRARRTASGAVLWAFPLLVTTPEIACLARWMAHEAKHGARGKASGDLEQAAPTAASHAPELGFAARRRLALTSSRPYFFCCNWSKATCTLTTSRK